MEYVIVWVVCGLLAGVINQDKGRTFFAGFALGLLLGPLGVIFALISSKKSLDTATCPYCQERVRPGAVVCKHCQSKLAVAMDEEIG